jgi:hypothetical protein
MTGQVQNSFFEFDRNGNDNFCICNHAAF